MFRLKEAISDGLYEAILVYLLLFYSAFLVHLRKVTT